MRCWSYGVGILFSSLGPDSFSKRKQLRCCGFRGGGHGRGLLMLSTAAASCCLLLSSTSTLAVASLSAPAAAAATCSPPTGGALLRHVSNHSRRVTGALVRCSAAGGGGDARRKRVYGWRGGAASFRGADTAKVCNNVGLVVVDGVFECSIAVAATQGVSGILRARQGLRHLFLAATSAFDATSTRHVSAKPL